MSITRVISAAAGSGKTTRLVQEYLDLLKAGCNPSDIIAITFTRAAGAELLDRVALTLRASVGDEAARRRLGGDFELYADRVPEDVAVRTKALRGLMNAPVGTTDSFVQRLLSEFALDACLQIEGEEPAWLDYPLGLGDADVLFEAAAREIIDPPDAPPPDAARTVLQHLSFSEALTQVAALAKEPVTAPLASMDSVTADLAEAVAGAFRRDDDPGKLARIANTTATRPFIDDVAAWVEAGMPSPACSALASWAAGIMTLTTKGTRSIRETFAELPGPPLYLGTEKLDLVSALKSLPTDAGWTPSASAPLRQALIELANRVRPIALRRCAETGELDYGLLLQAAVDLCEHPSRRLRGRFKALLVDEMQDANPAQMRLYRALQALPGGGDTLHTFFVGDARQSIYLFRGAEPALFERLLRDRTSADEDLWINYRSTPTLVAAQRALFSKVLETSKGDASEPVLPALEGVASIDDVEAFAKNSRHELAASAPHTAPIVLVTASEEADLNAAQVAAMALDVFAERLKHAWTSQAEGGEGRDGDTAAVLASSWAKAAAACARLRLLLGKDSSGRERAFIEGSRNLLGGQTAADLRVLVRALWDSTDRIAWAALWKLPPVGLTDGGLARLQLGQGVVYAGTPLGGLAGPAYATGLDPTVHLRIDVEAFAAVIDPLKDALGGIGRLPTADVVDVFAARMNWRAILAAGPDGDDAVAQLEVLLDHIRSVEADGVNPDAVVAALAPDEGDGDTPKVILDRGPGTVACTVVHQAKGLAWDHVHVYEAGGGGKGASSAWARQTVRRKTADGSWVDEDLIGTCMDFSGGIHPQPDFEGRLAAALHNKRLAQEKLRLLYVAVTRAKRSVTIGVNGGAGMSTELLQRWQRGKGAMPGVEFIDRDGPQALTDRAVGHAVAVEPFAVALAPATGRVAVSPSRMEEAWSPERRQEVATHALASGRFEGGTGRTTAPSEAWRQRPAAMGTLVHRWLECSDLSPSVTPTQAMAFLESEEQWPARTEAVARWLVNLSHALATHLPLLHAEITAPGATRHFEVPIHGAVDDGDERWLFSGSIDLLVELPDGRRKVIDFKGQAKADTIEDIRSGATLQKYAAQVEAYRSACAAAGFAVDSVGLLYVGSAAYLEW